MKKSKACGTASAESHAFVNIYIDSIKATSGNLIILFIIKHQDI